MKKIITLVALILLLAGCSTENTSESSKQSPEFKNYNGKPLKIAVIGNQPTIKEKDLIKFTPIQLNQLNKLDSSQYDAIFIMKEYLEQAAESKYAKIYKSLNIPTFFIQTEKSFIPFIIEDLSYNDAPESEDQMFATGFLQKNKEGYQSWSFGLYNDTVNETNIKDMYSRIFTTIKSIENEKEK